MPIYNWSSVNAVICDVATQEYKSGNARGLKVTKRNYDLCLS